MQDKLYAVIDTNVVVSALFSLEGNSNPSSVMRCIMRGRIVPLYNEEILAEYVSVLSREKFPFDKSDIDNIINLFLTSGLCLDRVCTNEDFADLDDLVFYEVTLSKEGAFLVTGNQKHYPKKPFVVTPAEMINIVIVFENKDKNMLCEEGESYIIHNKKDL